MTRTPEVLDVWFDSGSMPLAQHHYPFEEPKGKPAQGGSALGGYFPADFISEAIDQTRGWFYTLHAVATLLHKAGVVPKGNAYDNVICHGHVLDGQGKKMSKSKGNVIDSFQMFNTYGADMLRWAMLSMNQPGLPKRFDDKVMRDVQNRVFRMLWNSYSFFMTYASIDDWKPKENGGESEHVLDRWILADCNYLVHEVRSDLDRYDVYSATQTIEKFIDNLSNWYIRRSRNRFWKNENDDDKEHAYRTLYAVLVTLSKLMAPFTPFLSEEIYRNLTGGESVHLADWPEETELEGGELRKEMLSARLLVTQGLKMRSEAGVKVRQPLSEFSIGDIELRDELKEILADELNVKTVVGGKPLGLDIEITPELRLEGQAREIIRAIQEGRKKAGFNVEDRISLGYDGMANVFADEQLKKLIAGETLAEGGAAVGELADADYTESVSLDGESFMFWIKKI